MRIRIFVLALLLILASGAAAQQSDSGLYGNETSQSGTSATSLKTLQDISDTILPSELQIEQVRTDNIVASMVGTTAVSTHLANESLVQRTARDLGSGEGYEALLSIYRGSLNGSNSFIPVSRELSVYEITPVYENKPLTVYRTRKTLSLSFQEDYEEVWLLDVVADSVASNFSDLWFPESPPQVLQENPLVLFWQFHNVTEDEDVNITYYIKTLVVGDEGTRIFGVVNDINRGDISTVTDADDDNEEEDNVGDIIQRQIRRLGFDFSNDLIMFSLIAGLLILLGIGIMELESRDVFEPLKDLWCDCECFYRIGFKNTKMLDRYVQECIENGYHIEDIRISLLRAGWDRKAIRKMLRKYK